MHTTLVCEIVGFDQIREVKAIRAADGVNFERLEPGEPGPATLTLQLPTGGTFKVTMSNADFEAHVAPLMDRTAEQFLESCRAFGLKVPQWGNGEFTLRFASDEVTEEGLSHQS